MKMQMGRPIMAASTPRANNFNSTFTDYYTISMDFHISKIKMGTLKPELQSIVFFAVYFPIL